MMVVYCHTNIQLKSPWHRIPLQKKKKKKGKIWEFANNQNVSMSQKTHCKQMFRMRYDVVKWTYLIYQSVRNHGVGLLNCVTIQMVMRDVERKMPFHSIQCSLFITALRMCHIRENLLQQFTWKVQTKWKSSSTSRLHAHTHTNTFAVHAMKQSY